MKTIVFVGRGVALKNTTVTKVGITGWVSVGRFVDVAFRVGEEAAFVCVRVMRGAKFWTSGVDVVLEPSRSPKIALQQDMQIQKKRNIAVTVETELFVKRLIPVAGLRLRLIVIRNSPILSS